MRSDYFGALQGLTVDRVKLYYLADNNQGQLVRGVEPIKALRTQDGGLTIPNGSELVLLIAPPVSTNVTPGTLQRRISVIKKEFSTSVKSIEVGTFLMLHGPRSSGKTSMLISIMDHYCESYFSFYISLQGLCKNHFTSMDLSSVVLSNCLVANILFSILIFIDEFDKVHYYCNNDTKDRILEKFRYIKENGQDIIQSIVVAGPFNILSLSSTSSSGSPFNVRESLCAPNFTLEEVTSLFAMFQANSNVTLDPLIVDDVFERTNGHPGVWNSSAPKAIIEMEQYPTTHRIIQVIQDRTYEHYTLLLDLVKMLLYSPSISVNSNNPTARDSKKSTLRVLVSEGLASIDEEDNYSIRSPAIHQLLLSSIIYRGAYLPCEAVYHTQLYTIIERWRSGYHYVKLSTNVRVPLPTVDPSQRDKRYDLVLGKETGP
eukprot:gene6797-7902_t